MTNRFNKLELQPIGSADIQIDPARGLDLTLDSPAVYAFRDFRKGRPLVLEQGTSVDEAANLMRKAHVELKQVVDQDDHFLGVVSKQMVTGPEVLRIMQSGGLERADVSVNDVMLHRDDLHALTLQQVEASRIGDVLETMREIGEMYILVVDRDANSICGIIFADQIAKVLHVPVEVTEKVSTFAEVHDALEH